MATDLKLTWDKATKRWCKVYRGRKLYLGYGKSKSDTHSYQLALEQFDLKRAEIDGNLQANKPYRAEYAEAIRLRQAMVKWFDLEGNGEQYDMYPLVTALDAQSDRSKWSSWKQEYDRLIKEIERLNLDAARMKPPQLGQPGTLPIDPIAHVPLEQREFWEQRIDILRQYERWTKPKDPANTLEAWIAKFLKERATQARTGDITAKRYDTCRRDMKLFETFTGPLAIEQFGGRTLANFHAHLLDKISRAEYSRPYARTILTDVKYFTTWLWESDAIDDLPRNFRRLKISVDKPTPITIPIPTVKAMLKGATGRVKLYILLMLNCGFTQMDFADLNQAEVDWTRGRISRKRGKTEKFENVPVVHYKLWTETFRLLQRFRSSHPSFVLVNERGNPLRQLALKDDDKLATNDSIRKALKGLCDDLQIKLPPPKRFRKTSSSLIYNSKFRGLSSLFLGHAPKSVADTHYNAADETILDEAIDFLGQEYGEETQCRDGSSPGPAARG